MDNDVLRQAPLFSALDDDAATALRSSMAETRLRRFEEVGPPEAVPLRQNVKMRLKGGRTAKRAVVATGLELRTGVGALMKPFDSEIWFGERVGILGSNGSGKSHFLRLLAAGGSQPEAEHEPVGDIRPAPVEHAGRVVLGSRVRPGWFAQTHDHAALHGRTLLEILHRGDEHRPGMPRDLSARALDRYSRPGCRSSCLSCLAPPCSCSTSRPTTSTCIQRRRWRTRSRHSKARSSP